MHANTLMRMLLMWTHVYAITLYLSMKWDVQVLNNGTCLDRDGSSAASRDLAFLQSVRFFRLDRIHDHNQTTRTTQSVKKVLPPFGTRVLVCSLWLTAASCQKHSTVSTRILHKYTSIIGSLIFYDDMNNQNKVFSRVHWMASVLIFKARIH